MSSNRNIKTYAFVHKSSNDAQKVKKKQPVPPILQLSPEYRTPIWNYLAPSDKKSIRLVCRDFKNAIDTRSGLPINLDERKFLALDVVKTLPPTASSLRIWGAELTQSYVNRLLLTSGLVTSVAFSGPIDLVNFTKVLTRCTNIKSLTVTDRSAFDKKVRLLLKLRNIHVLNLGTEAPISDYGDAYSPTPWSTYDDILRNVTLPCLRVLKIEYMGFFTSSDFQGVISTILQYLILHKTVKDVTLRLHKGMQNSAQNLDVNFTPSQFGLVQYRKVKLDLDEDAFKVAELLLANQTSLEFLDCWNGDKDWDYYSEIIKRNAEDLKTIRIRKLALTPEARIDLFVLEKCVKLQELFLTRFGNSAKEVCYRQVTRKSDESPFLNKISNKLPEVVRFQSLPTSITRLQIQGFSVKTEDLSWIPIKLKDLQLLELQLLGYCAPKGISSQGQGHLDSMPRDVSRHGFGVTPLLLKEICTKLRKLDTLFIEEFYNNRTAWKDPMFRECMKKISLIPGESLISSQGYFGILIDSKLPSPLRRVPRTERNDLWDIRLSQYQYRKWIQQKWDEKSRGDGDK